jgi:hypothetical protein
VAKDSVPISGLAAALLGYNTPGQAPTPPEDEPYFAALGRFITSYAIAEHQVHLLARRLTRLNDAKARIVFSGMRLGDLAERIRGLLRVTRTTIKRYNEIDLCLQQLDFIATQRNNLVHRYVIYQHGQIEVTNIVVSKSIEVSERQIFGIADFESMDSDCASITLRLRVVCGGLEVPPPLLKWARWPWRYKPPQPARRPKQRHSTLRSQKRQPHASRG